MWVYLQSSGVFSRCYIYIYICSHWEQTSITTPSTQHHNSITSYNRSFILLSLVGYSQYVIMFCICIPKPFYYSHTLCSYNIVAMCLCHCLVVFLKNDFCLGPFSVGKNTFDPLSMKLFSYFNDIVLLTI